MFLLERAVGAAAYVFFLASVCVLLAFSTLRVKTVLRLYVLVLAVMAFLYQPYVTADLYRIRETAELYSQYSFSGFWREFAVHSSTPAARILYWVTGKTGIDGLLPALATVICYTCFFHIIAKSGELYKASHGNTALTLLFFMSVGQYMSVISNIRTMLAGAVIFYCFFREDVEKKFSWFHIILYAAAFFTHNLAVVFLGLRLLAPVLNRGRTPRARLCYFLVLLAGAAAMALLDGALMEDITEKVKAYLAGGYSYAWEYLIGMLMLLGATYVLVLRWRLRRYGGAGREICDFDACFLLSFVVTLASVPMFSLFYRLASGVIPILSVPSLMLGLEYYDDALPGRSGARKLSVQSVILILSLVILLLSCTRGDLCSYKFFTLS